MAGQPQPLQQGSETGTVPAQPQVQETGTQPTSETVPTITPSHQIQFPDANGQLSSVTVQDLVNAYRGRVPEEQKKQYELYDRAQKGDAEAIRELAGQLLPEAPAHVSQEDMMKMVEEMKGEIMSLRNTLSTRVEPTVNDIQTQREVAVFAQNLKAAAQQFPYTSHHPEGASLVQQRYRQLLEESRRFGVDPDQLTPEQRSQVAGAAVMAIEDHFKKTQEAFSGFTPQGPVNNAPANPTVINDQDINASPGNRAPIFQFTDQGYRDTRIPQATPQPGQPVPTNPVQVPPGGAPGAAPAGTEGPLTPGSMREQMRARLNSAGGY